MRPLRSPARVRWVLITAAAWAMGITPARAQTAMDAASTTRAEDPAAEPPPRLYRELGYGSDATFSPLSVAMNLGFEDFQRRGADRRFLEFPYRTSLRGVVDALKHPLESIDRYGGWWHFLAYEILPFSVDTGEAAWWPNYTTHLIGGHLQVRMLTEWYEAKGFPAPKVWSAVSFWGTSVLHEMNQFPGNVRGSAATLADLAFFDVAAVFLAHWDPSIRFFAGTLQAANWSPMATFTFPNEEISNMGDYWIYKIPLPFFDSTRLFWRVGYGAQWGLTHPLRNGYALTWGLGVDTKDHALDPVSLRESITTAFSGGLYLDRNNSLVASLNFSQRQWDPFTLNVYPGVLPGPAEPLGVWVKVDWDGQARFGVMHRAALGLGFGYGGR